MENNSKKCSLETHSNKKAVIYCKFCSIYMCEKCRSLHSELFKNHNAIPLNKNSIDNLNQLCEEKSHSIQIKYYCKTHNVLCCSKCIAKIKEKGNGQHRDCDVCFIEDFENEKKEKLNENIKNFVIF